MDLYQIISLIIVAIIIVNAFGFCIYCRLYDAWDIFIPFPIDFERKTEMNQFGCILCYILLFILFPIPNIGKIIYWIVHV